MLCKGSISTVQFATLNGHLTCTELNANASNACTMPPVARRLLRPVSCNKKINTVRSSMRNCRLALNQLASNAWSYSPPAAGLLALDELLTEYDLSQADATSTLDSRVTTFDEEWSEEPFPEFETYATGTVLDPVSAFAASPVYGPRMYDNSPLVRKEMGESSGFILLINSVVPFLRASRSFKNANQCFCNNF